MPFRLGGEPETHVVRAVEDVILTRPRREDRDAEGVPVNGAGLLAEDAAIELRESGRQIVLYLNGQPRPGESFL
jgi:hypothetical protein